MSLTQEQIDEIRLMMNGDPEDDPPRGVKQAISDLCRERNNVSALLLIHGDMTNDCATAVIEQIKARGEVVAAELESLLG